MNFRALFGLRPPAQLRLRPKKLLLFLRSRLSQRIALSVFSSIVAIEAILSLPAIHRREAALLQQLSDQSGASLMMLAAEWESQAQDRAQSHDVTEQTNNFESILEIKTANPLLELPPNSPLLGKNAHLSHSSFALQARFSQLEALPFVVGGSLYQETSPQTAQLIGSFGEIPQLNAAPLSESSDRPQPSSSRNGNLSQSLALSPQPSHRFHRRQRRFDSSWSATLPTNSGPSQYHFVVSHDTTEVHQAIITFISQLFVVVVLSSSVVTLATMVVLQSILITPILALRDDLRRAASAALQEQAAPVPFASRLYHQDHELGDVILAFEDMFEHISGAIALRHSAEAKLRESELRFRTLVEQAAESMLMLDRNGTVVSINPFALRSLQYPSQRWKPLNIFVIDSQLTPQAYSLHWQKLQLGSPLTFETVYRCHSGRTYPVEVRSSMIREDGQEYALCFVRNISDRKKAQATQARLAEVGELAAMIVHEVRNPLTTIYMVMDGFHRLALPPAGKLRLELAIEEAERLKRLLNEILSYSRGQKLQDEPIELNAFCKALWLSLKAMPAAQKRAIYLKTNPQPTWVKGDRDKLKQVFINLITNACEAIAPGESVVWTIELAASNQFMIAVQNGGEPIPPEILPKLTQPFISTKASGNGLGLALTKRIVEAHGGSLKITSQAELGTTVTVQLPSAIPPQALDAQPLKNQTRTISTSVANPASMTKVACPSIPETSYPSKR